MTCWCRLPFPLAAVDCLIESCSQLLSNRKNRLSFQSGCWMKSLITEYRPKSKKKCLHFRCDQVMTQPYVTVSWLLPLISPPHYLRLMAAVFVVYVLWVNAFLNFWDCFCFWFDCCIPRYPQQQSTCTFQPKRPTQSISQENWHTSSQFVWKQWQWQWNKASRGLTTWVSRKRCQAGMKWLLFHKTETKNNPKAPAPNSHILYNIHL